MELTADNRHSSERGADSLVSGAASHKFAAASEISSRDYTVRQFTAVELVNGTPMSRCEA